MQGMETNSGVDRTPEHVAVVSGNVASDDNRGMLNVGTLGKSAFAGNNAGEASLTKMPYNTSICPSRIRQRFQFVSFHNR